MHSDAKTVDEYVSGLPMDRKIIIEGLLERTRAKLQPGFEEIMDSGMIVYVVPLSTFSEGYLDDPTKPLPFLGMASQKNKVSFYSFGIYARDDIKEWFVGEYLKRTGKKPDMGKSCIRLNPRHPIPYDLFGELATKITVDEWVEQYRSMRKK